MGISSRIDLDVGTQPLTTNKPDFLDYPMTPGRASLSVFTSTHTSVHSPPSPFLFQFLYSGRHNCIAHHISREASLDIDIDFLFVWEGIAWTQRS